MKNDSKAEMVSIGGRIQLRYIGTISIFLIFLISLMGSGFAQESVSEKKANLEKTKKKIQVQKKQLESLKGKEITILKNLTQIDQKKSQLQGQKGGLEKNIQGLSEEIKKTSNSIDVREKKISERRGSISNQLRDLYMHGEMNYMKIFLASATFDDLNQKQFLVRQWVENDRKKIRGFQDEAYNLQLEKQSLENTKIQKRKDLGELEQTEKEILQEKASKKKLLTMVKNQKDYYQKSIEELEQASKNLETLIKQFKSKPVQKGEAGGVSSSLFS